MNVKFGQKCNDTPLSEGNLTFFDCSYEAIYNLTKDEPVVVYPVYTPKNSAAGKALILSDDETVLIAKLSVNGLVSIVDKALFDRYFKIKTMNHQEAEKCWLKVVELFKLMGIFKSIQRFPFNDFLSNEISNFCITVSRDQDYFLNEMFGNFSSNRNIHIDKVIGLDKNGLFEQVSFNVFHSFKISMRPVDEKIKVSFILKVFKAYAVCGVDQQESIEKIIKKLIKAYLEKKFIHMDIDYILTPDFFEQWKMINAMIDY